MRHVHRAAYQPQRNARRTCNMQRTTCNVQRTTCNVQRTTCKVQHATDDMQRATCNGRHATRNVQPACSGLRTNLAKPSVLLASAGTLAAALIGTQLLAGSCIAIYDPGNHVPAGTLGCVPAMITAKRTMPHAHAKQNADGVGRSVSPPTRSVHAAWCACRATGPMVELLRLVRLVIAPHARLDAQARRKWGYTVATLTLYHTHKSRFGHTCSARRRPTHVHSSASARNWARRCRIGTGTGLAAAASAPRLGSPLPHPGSALPNPHRDWAHPCHICTPAPGLTVLQAVPARHIRAMPRVPHGRLRPGTRNRRTAQSCPVLLHAATCCAVSGGRPQTPCCAQSPNCNSSDSCARTRLLSYRATPPQAEPRGHLRLCAAARD